MRLASISSLVHIFQVFLKPQKKYKENGGSGGSKAGRKRLRFRKGGGRATPTNLLSNWLLT